MTKKYRWIFIILITICMSMILILISSIALDYHRNVWRYLGGPVSDGVVPQKVIEWLLIVTPIWAICGWWLNNQFSLVQMTVFRYGNIDVWWKQQIKEVYLLHSWYYILMFVVLKLRIHKYWTDSLYLEILMILMIFIHSLFMLTIMILVRVAVNNMLASFTCILMLEILSIYATAQNWFCPKYYPFVWGMYNVSNQIYPNKGYAIDKSIILLIVFIIVLNVVIFLDKKLLKRSLNHGKNRIDRSE